MRIKFSGFARRCNRCDAIRIEPGAPQVLVDVYQTIGQPLQAFSESMQRVKGAEKRLNDAEAGRTSSLAVMEKQFRVTRAAVAAMVPTTVLPDTLKSQRTDTDKRHAILELKSAVEEHAGAAWADNLMQGEFGQKAPAAILHLTEYIEAGNALQKAKADRVSAFGPAWSAFVKYKRLVEATLGSSSRQYQGLRLRTVSASSDEAEEAEAEVEGDEADEVEADEVEADEVETDEVEADAGAPDAPESMAAPSAP